MSRASVPYRVKARQEKVLEYWKRQLNKELRSDQCKSSDEYIKSQIEILEAKIKGAV